MQRMRLVGLLIMAVCAISAVTASAAFAGSGPHWMVEGSKLEAGKSVNILSKNKSETFKLKVGSVITIVCKSANNTGTIIGGSPGTDKVTVVFSECAVEGYSLCTVHSPGKAGGSIEVVANTELIYLGTKEEAEKEEGKLGDRFTPPTGNIFVEIVTEGTCPPLTKGTNKVEGSVIGEVTPVNTEKEKGTLTFPTPAIGKGWQWIKMGEVKEVKSSLKVFGILTAEEIGEESVELENHGIWGAFTS